ncbi:MAG: GAF domain-containing protein [Nocardioides sp.]
MTTAPELDPGVRSEIASAGDLETLGRIARTAARRVAGSEGATFVLRDGDRCFYADEDTIAPLWKGQRFPINECISGWTMLNAEPAVIPDITVDARIPQAAYRSTYVQSLVMVPVGTPPAAAIGVYWDSQATRTSVVPALRDLAAHVGARLDELGLASAPWAPNFSSDA